MNREDLQVGDLVHIPASVDLIRFDDFAASPLVPTHTSTTTLPGLGVVTSLGDNYYTEVYYGGARWSVRNNNVYRLEESKQND